MTTFTTEYQEKLWEIQSMNILKRAVLVPHNEKIMDIDLNTRKISVPEFLSVSRDHESETIYFKFDRYFDMTDLTTTTCIIQYKNANGEEYVYPVPFYDIETYASQGKVLIPWCIQGPVTRYAGVVQFSIRFFRLSNEDDHHIIYDLNTIPATGKVLEGQNWSLNDITLDQITIDNSFMYNIQRIMDAQNALNLYWLVV